MDLMSCAWRRNENLAFILFAPTCSNLRHLLALLSFLTTAFARASFLYSSFPFVPPTTAFRQISFVPLRKATTNYSGALEMQGEEEYLRRARREGRIEETLKNKQRLKWRQTN
jgi:hypothetical protein